MKILLLCALIIVLSVSFAFAQAGYIGITSDATGLDCNLWDNVAGLVTYYVIHGGTPGAAACQFMAAQPGCMVAAIWLSDTSMFPVSIGDSQNGIAIGYGSCLVGPIAVLAINYFGQGMTTPCCIYKPTGDPATVSGQIEVVDCNNNLLIGSAVCAVINPDASCPCWATPVEKSTWGKVKELYAQ